MKPTAEQAAKRLLKQRLKFYFAKEYNNDNPYEAVEEIIDVCFQIPDNDDEAAKGVTEAQKPKSNSHKSLKTDLEKEQDKEWAKYFNKKR